MSLTSLKLASHLLEMSQDCKLRLEISFAQTTQNVSLSPSRPNSECFSPELTKLPSTPILFPFVNFHYPDFQVTVHLLLFLVQGYSFVNKEGIKENDKLLTVTYRDSSLASR
jgi:hypothetical protein